MRVYRNGILVSLSGRRYEGFGSGVVMDVDSFTDLVRQGRWEITQGKEVELEWNWVKLYD